AAAADLTRRADYAAAADGAAAAVLRIGVGVGADQGAAVAARGLAGRTLAGAGDAGLTLDAGDAAGAAILVVRLQVLAEPIAVLLALRAADAVVAVDRIDGADLAGPALLADPTDRAAGR